MITILICIIALFVGIVLTVGAAFAGMVALLAYAKWIILGIVVVVVLAKLFGGKD